MRRSGRNHRGRNRGQKFAVSAPHQPTPTSIARAKHRDIIAIASLHAPPLVAPLTSSRGKIKSAVGIFWPAQHQHLWRRRAPNHGGDSRNMFASSQQQPKQSGGGGRKSAHSAISGTHRSSRRPIIENQPLQPSSRRAWPWHRASCWRLVICNLGSGVAGEASKSVSRIEISHVADAKCGGIVIAPQRLGNV